MLQSIESPYLAKSCFLRRLTRTPTPRPSLALTSLRPIVIVIVLLVVQAKVQPKHQGQNDNDQDHNAEHDPLELSPGSRMPDTLVNVLIGGLLILGNFVRLLLGLGHHWLLHFDSGCKLVKQRRQLDQGALDVL